MVGACHVVVNGGDLRSGGTPVVPATRDLGVDAVVKLPNFVKGAVRKLPFYELNDCVVPLLIGGVREAISDAGSMEDVGSGQQGRARFVQGPGVVSRFWQRGRVVRLCLYLEGVDGRIVRRFRNASVLRPERAKRWRPVLSCLMIRDRPRLGTKLRSACLFNFVSI